MTSMLVSLRLLPPASVFNQHLHPLGFTPLQQVYGNTAWKFVFGIFAIATIGKLDKIRTTTSDSNVKDDSLGQVSRPCQIFYVTAVQLP